MENDGTVYHPGNKDNLSQNNEEPRQHKLGPDVKLSPEEIRAFRECNKESFYYRSTWARKRNWFASAWARNKQLLGEKAVQVLHGFQPFGVRLISMRLALSLLESVDDKLLVTDRFAFSCIWNGSHIFSNSKRISFEFFFCVDEIFYAGYLTPHPKWGPSLKMAGASFIGWLLGKLSYRSYCEDKFLKLENSIIGDAIRKRRGYVPETFQSEIYPSSSMEYDKSSKSDITVSGSGDYHSSSGSLNFDLDKNLQYSGLDDRERPTADSIPELIKEDEQRRQGTTYDELRRRNREKSTQESRNKEPSQPRSRLSVAQKTAGYGFDDKSSKFDHEQTHEGNKNEYGDAWEKSPY